MATGASTTVYPLADPDLLIVGGGPAGAATAIAAAQLGLSVVLIERQAEPREKPGEALHPGMEPLLNELGLDSDDLEAVTGARFEGVWSAWGTAARFEPFGSDDKGPWHGFQVRRAAFEELLLARAKAAGADVRRGAAAGSPRMSNGRVIGAGDLRAAWTIDASGPARWLGRRLDLGVVARSPVLLARYGYVTGRCPDRDEAPLIEGGSEGWTWIARIDRDLYQWVRLDFDGRVRARDWRPAPLQGLAESRPTQGAEVAWRRAVRAAGPGWLMVGDAAASLDPASSHGILKAVMSGVMAAQTASAVLRQGAPETAAMDAYHRWLAGWFDADAERLGAAYRALGARGFD